MSYKQYQHLLGLPYIAGKQDCYGLAMNYYKNTYGIQLADAARPDEWWNHPELSLIDDFINQDGWEQLGTNTRILKPADGLVFSLISGRANHVGVYVGNGNFIHHVWQRFSSEEALMDKWQSRLLMIIRHPEVVKQSGVIQTVDLFGLLPERIQQRYDV